jgi:hypothetical protein
METLPPLDAHAHLDPERTLDELAASGAVLAMTLSLDEAARVVDRAEPQIAWGVGCHPRRRKPQEAFDAERFGELAERTAIVGEIGLDTGARVPLELQLRTSIEAGSWEFGQRATWAVSGRDYLPASNSWQRRGSRRYESSTGVAQLHATRWRAARTS